MKQQILEKRAKIKSRDAGGWAGEILMRVEATDKWRFLAIFVFFLGTLWVIYGDFMVIDIIDQLDVIFGSVTSTKIDSNTRTHDLSCDSYLGRYRIFRGKPKRRFHTSLPERWVGICLQKT